MVVTLRKEKSPIMKKILHDIGLTMSILTFPLIPLIKIFVAIYKAITLAALLAIHYIDYIIHYKSYRNKYHNQKRNWEKLFNDYDNGDIAMSIDYPKD